VTVVYAREQDLPAGDYIAVLDTTYMRDKRPLANRNRIDAMLRGSNVIVTARDEDGAILGLARGITDGVWVCYIADLVVRDGTQGRGIGTGILDECSRLLGPGIGIVLVAYPPAEPFYRRIGMGEMQAFYRERTDST
jgi:GNAT superfamily N-acetyltransferase